MSTSNTVQPFPLARLIRAAHLDEVLDSTAPPLDYPVPTSLALLTHNARLEQALAQEKSRTHALTALNQIYTRELEQANRRSRELARLRRNTQSQNLQHLHATIEQLESEIVRLQRQLHLATGEANRWRQEHQQADRRMAQLQRRLSQTERNDVRHSEVHEHEIYR